MQRNIVKLEHLDASLYTWNRLWSSDTDAKSQLNILDIISIEEAVITKWLFTAKEGEIKCKSKQRRVKSELMERMIKNNSQFGDFQSTFTHSSLSEWYKISKLEDIDDIIANNPHLSKVIVTRPNGLCYSNNFLLITCDADLSSLDIARMKVKCQTILNFCQPIQRENSDLKKVCEKNKNEKGALQILPCRNQKWLQQAHEYAENLFRILGSKSGHLISHLKFTVMVEDISATRIENAPSARFWLHHVDSVRYEQKDCEEQQRSSACSVDSRKSGKITCGRSVYSSSSSYVRSSDLCFGDLCSCGDAELEEIRTALEFSELDEVDMVTEAHEAVKRHRPTEDSSNSNLLEFERASQAMSSSGVPVRNRKVIYKTIALAREEIQQIEEIKKLLEALPERSLEELQNFRSQISEIWPLPLAKWWLNNGKLNQRNPNGKVPKKLFGSETNSGIDDDGDSLDISSTYSDWNNAVKKENKWFSFFYSLVLVCENCYRNYQEIESYRRNRLARQGNVLHNPLSEEERKLKDREIEAKIFAQRKLSTKLAKCKSAPAQLPSISSVSSSSSSTSRKRVQPNTSSALPPLPWKPNYGEIVQERSVASHILKKKPTSNYSIATDENNNFWKEWEEATRPPQWKEPIPQIRRVPMPSEPKVDVTNYSADRLLHPWQRGVDKLRQEVRQQRDANFALNDQNSDANANADDSDEDETLGWNPFVIKLDGNNTVSIVT